MVCDDNKSCNIVDDKLSIQRNLLFIVLEYYNHDIFLLSCYILTVLSFLKTHCSQT